LEILTSDDARELFAKAIKPGKEIGADSFMQVRSDENVPFEHAYTALKTVATATHSFRLAQLAVTVRTAKSGHFDSVIASIDEIYQNLKDEGKADVAKRDECKDKNQEITSTVNDLDWKMSVNQANIDKLEKQIENREAEKTQTLEEIEDMTTQIAGMEEQRKSDHEAFLVTKSDDEGAIGLLQQQRKPSPSSTKRRRNLCCSKTQISLSLRIRRPQLISAAATAAREKVRVWSPS